MLTEKGLKLLRDMAPDDKITDDFHARVYKLGGAVTSSAVGDTHHYAVMSLPGIITKFEPIHEAVARLDEYEKGIKK